MTWSAEDELRSAGVTRFGETPIKPEQHVTVGRQDDKWLCSCGEIIRSGRDHQSAMAEPELRQERLI